MVFDTTYMYVERNFLIGTHAFVFLADDRRPFAEMNRIHRPPSPPPTVKAKVVVGYDDDYVSLFAFKKANRSVIN